MILNAPAVWKDPSSVAALGSDDAAAAYVSAVRRLDALAFDGEKENLRVLLGGAEGVAAEYRAIASELERFLSRRPDFSWAYALRGKALLNGGDAAAAVECLERSIGLDAGLCAAYLWNAQALLVLGRFEDALRDLDRHDALSAGGLWSHLLRGLCLSRRGDGAGGRREFKRALRWSPGSVAARALQGLLDAESGHAQRGLRLLESATRHGGSAPDLLAMKGLVQRQLGDLEGSLSSLDRAIRKAPSAWMYSHRADVLNRMGFYREALDDLGRMACCAPSQPQAFAQAANVLFDQAFYEEAGAAMQAALRRRPDDPGLRARRARMLFVEGELESAAREADRARELAPEDDTILTEWARIAAYCGREAGLEELLDRRWAGMPLKELLLGVLRCRKGELAAARRHWTRAERLYRAGEDPQGAETAALYALMTRLLEDGGSLRRTEGGLHMLSVGVRHPFQTTLEAVQVLAASARIFNNVPDPQIVEFLGLFPGRLVAVPRRRDEGHGDRAGWILDRLPKAEPAAFVTRLHPLMYRRIGFDLVRLARERGIAFRCYGAVAQLELISSLAAEKGWTDASGALRCFDPGYLRPRPQRVDPAHATVLYCLGTERERVRLCRSLRTLFPPRHPVFLMGGSGQREWSLLEIPLARLEKALENADAACIVYLPAHRGDARLAAVGG